jgi:hypothetical protein
MALEPMHYREGDPLTPFIGSVTLACEWRD